jgi:hypothetical protein
MSNRMRRMMDEKIDVGPNSSSDQGGLFSNIDDFCASNDG